MKAIKTLVAIALAEIIIAIPLVTGIYAWGMLAFQPTENTTNGNECSVVGTFDGSFTGLNGEEYYHFKSNDHLVWWSLTEREMGFVPKDGTEYVLTYDNKGTTKANKPCDCNPEWECECEVYDDELICIEEVL